MISSEMWRAMEERRFGSSYKVPVRNNNMINNSRKLTMEQAREIRSLIGKIPRTEIAKRFGISVPKVTRIANHMVYCEKEHDTKEPT